jgi:hypothetical protein
VRPSEARRFRRESTSITKWRRGIRDAIFPAAETAGAAPFHDVSLVVVRPKTSNYGAST